MDAKLTRVPLSEILRSKRSRSAYMTLFKAAKVSDGKRKPKRKQVSSIQSLDDEPTAFLENSTDLSSEGRLKEWTRQCVTCWSTMEKIMVSRGYRLADDTPHAWHSTSEYEAAVNEASPGTAHELFETFWSKGEAKQRVVCMSHGRMGVAQWRAMRAAIDLSDFDGLIVVTNYRTDPSTTEMESERIMSKKTFEIFEFSDLLVNRLAVDIVPEHKRVSDIEVQSLISALHTTTKALPTIFDDDIIIRYMGCKADDFVMITINTPGYPVRTLWKVSARTKPWVIG